MSPRSFRSEPYWCASVSSCLDLPVSELPDPERSSKFPHPCSHSASEKTCSNRVCGGYCLTEKISRALKSIRAARPRYMLSCDGFQQPARISPKLFVDDLPYRGYMRVRSAKYSKIVSHCHDLKKTTQILSFVCSRSRAQIMAKRSVSRSTAVFYIPSPSRGIPKGNARHTPRAKRRGLGRVARRDG
jgi:hypothetical protein